MFRKTNAEKLMKELAEQRDKQQRRTKVEKKIDESSEKIDSGIVSDLSQSLDSCSKDSITPDDLPDTNAINVEPVVVSPEDTTKTDCTADSNIDSGLQDVDPPTQYDWRRHFKPDQYGDTHLHLAIHEGFIKESEILIKLCSDSKLLDIQNYDGQTALHLAVLKNECRIVECLMEAKANAELVDYDGNTAIHLACYNGFLDCLRILSKHVELSKILDIINYEGLACIHIATITNHLNTLKFIVDHSRNVNIKDYKSGYTALHFAKTLHRDNLIGYLVEKVDTSIESYAGRLAFEVDYDFDDDDDDDDDDEDEDDEENYSENFKKLMNETQLPINNSIKC